MNIHLSAKLFYSVFLAGFLISSAAVASESNELYKLSEGDILEVSVWGEESLKKEIRVLPDGSITFPLAGRVEVGGTTTPEAEKRITEKLKTYLPDPQVTVVISNTNGNLVYVIGKVLKSGPILLTSPLTVLQALSQAGGLDKFAEADELKVLRSTKNGSSVISVNYNNLIQGKALETNVLLKTGDTILVP
jgi:polysaccharide export outer membrane protein